MAQESNATYDLVGSTPLSSISYSTVIKPLIDLEGRAGTLGSWMDFLSNVAVSPTLRDAANGVKKLWAELDIDLGLRKDVFERILAFSGKEEAHRLGMETDRYVRKKLRDGARNGLELSDKDKEEFVGVKKKISDLGIGFRSCLSEDTSHIYVKEEDLAGVSKDLISALERGPNGELKVTTKYTHYYPVIKTCSNPQTRLRMEKVYMSRCLVNNTKALDELVELRQRQASLLGYANHAAYVQEERMAKDPRTVSDFLKGLKEKLEPLWNAEKEVLLKYKKAEMETLGLEYDGIINKEDFWYYIETIKEKEFAVDQEQLKEYFPIEKVTSGMMDIYQQLLGLTFSKVDTVKVWHEDVQLYQVDDTDTKETLGYFFLDLFPREGKYGHAAVWSIQAGSLDSEGRRQKAVTGMACNFAKPTADRPSLLNHREVQTYFHEFGHVMHGVVSRTNLSTFYGTHVERDFVEAPSQMLENWTWEDESLKMMSGHYITGEPLPKQLLEKLVASKVALAGALTFRQLFFASYDQMVHTQGTADTAALAREMYREIMGIEEVEGGNIGANLGHLVGYDAGYYGYLWSRVFSEDMFETRFKAEGILNPDTGRDYRNMILRPGGSIDGSVMIRNFLGREPTQDAFLRSKGLVVA